MNHKDLAQDILKHIGGSENVQNAIHCMTRLRLTLKDSSRANSEEISRLDGVIQVADTAGQYQIIIGNDVG
ncbi:PTS transporter subunit EIIB, partial [Bacillus altitudinis]|uniref:PTS transporter subunit EIIB n=4 Tax=Bacillaceae TaxID=186817 RepID=UPI002280672C